MKRDAFSILLWSLYQTGAEKNNFRIEPNTVDQQKMRCSDYVLLIWLVGEATDVEADFGFGLYVIKSKHILISLILHAEIGSISVKHVLSYQLMCISLWYTRSLAPNVLGFCFQIPNKFFTQSQ